MIERMTKYSFILLSEDEPKFLSDLQGLGVVDITRSSKPVDERSAQLLAQAQTSKRIAAKLKGLDFSKDPDWGKISEAAGAEGTQKPLSEAQGCLGRIDELNSALVEARLRREARARWGLFDRDRLAALGTEGVKVRFYSVRKDSFDPSWAERYAIQEISRDAYYVHFVTVSDDPGYDFPVAEAAAPDGTFEESDREIAAMQAELLDCKSRLFAISRDCKDDIGKTLAAQNAELDRYLAQASSEKAAEDRVVVLQGFVPTESDEKVSAALADMPAYCITESAKVEDEPPIKLRNNKFVGLFDMLTDMYGRPAYNEFDPTVFISIFFTLFFAFCMGDMGYGLVFLLLGFLMKRTSMSKIGSLAITLGAATTVIGFLFHSFFGTDMSQWGLIRNAGLDRLMVPSDKVTIPGLGEYDWTMILAIICGVVHIAIAQVTKAVVATRNDGFTASLGVWGWTLLIVGFVVIGAFALVGVLNNAATKIAIIVVGIASALLIFLLRDIHKNPLANIGAGLWETYNTATGLLSDVLSYLRLYALALAGGLLGGAFNDMATLAKGDGGLGWVFFILILVLGHTLNIAMSGLSAFVHPLRLNFLEFFKNAGYGGLGRRYAPLGGDSK